MKKHRFLRGMVLACFLLTAAAAQAATRSDVINGATCIGYPPWDYSVAVPYQFFLYGFNGGAFCQLTMPDQWNADELQYVLFNAEVSGGVLSARLCMHADSSTWTCGHERTINAEMVVNWVAVPSQMPKFPSGAYVQLKFPKNKVSVVRSLVPVWSD